MMSWAKQLLTLSLSSLLSTTLYAEPITWQHLQTGLDYTTIPMVAANNLPGKLHAFRIDLAQYQLNLATANDFSRNSASAQMFGTHQHALIAINGGFFTPRREILGLRITNGKILSPLKPISWWSVFYVKNNNAYIVPSKNFQSSNDISFAVQSGPRLVVNGAIPSLKPGVDERSALCITRDGKVIIAATENTPIATKDLAKILKQSNKNGGLDCQNALNLDGGSSTQLYAKIDDFDLDVPNFNTVTDAVIVLPKSN